MTRDPQFGPMLMFGLGGIFVEVMKDVTFHLAPITADEARQMLQGTRSYALLRGARGESPVDLDAIAAGLQRRRKGPLTGAKKTGPARSKKSTTKKAAARSRKR